MIRPVTLSGAPISISDGKTLIGTYISVAVAVGVGVAVGVAGAVAVAVAVDVGADVGAAVAEEVGVGVADEVAVGVAEETGVAVEEEAAVAEGTATSVCVAVAVASETGLSVGGGVSVDRGKAAWLVTPISACAVAEAVGLSMAAGRAAQPPSPSENNMNAIRDTTTAKTTPAASGFPRIRLRAATTFFCSPANLSFIVIRHQFCTVTVTRQGVG